MRKNASPSTVHIIIYSDHNEEAMILPEEVFQIGYISKQRGLRGEVEMVFTDDCFEDGTADYFVLDMDGLLVPFFWEEYRFKNSSTLILALEDIDTEEKARRLVGHRVFYPKKHVAQSEDGGERELSSYRALTGFTATDEKGQPIGTVEAVDDSSANVLLTLRCEDGKERVIPFHDDFLTDYDIRERYIRLRLPDGLLDIND